MLKKWKEYKSNPTPLLQWAKIIPQKSHLWPFWQVENFAVMLQNIKLNSWIFFIKRYKPLALVNNLNTNNKYNTIKLLSVQVTSVQTRFNLGHKYKDTHSTAALYEFTYITII